MPQDPTAADVVVIGGGVIGLAVAWRAAQRGRSVCVLERGELGGGASHVAAGMLAPVTEADPGELALLELGLRSARAWPAFAAELAGGVGHRSRTAPLRRARRRARPRRGRGARSRAGAAQELGLAVERLLPSAARRLEPALAPTTRLALAVPGDHATNPRATVTALAEAGRRVGAVISTGRPAERILWRGAKIAGVRCADGSGRRDASGSSSPRARGAAPSAGSRTARGSRCARSRARSCACATRRAPACSSGSCASTAATSSRAATGATCSARRWRSAASTRRSPPAGSTSCCATPASSCPACTS